MKGFHVTAGLGLAGCLAACGGGGGSGGGEVASLPPPPAQQRNASLADLQFSENFGGAASDIQFTVSRATGGATRRGDAAVRSTDGASVRYDAATRSYTVTGAAITSPAFGPNERLADGSTGAITVYERRSGSGQENLALFNPGAANPQLALTYTSYGAYQRITDGANVDVDTTFFTYGIRTASADMPRTGSATYTTRIDGQFADNTGVYSLAGASGFSADFAAATVAFSMTPVGSNVVDGSVKNFGTFDVAGRIGGSNGAGTFSGNTATSTNGYSAGVQGYFNGPNAAEIGGTFNITGNQGFGAGAVVGRKN